MNNGKKHLTFREIEEEYNITFDDIIFLINDYSDFKKQGNNYMFRCFFHDEDTPSFVISKKGIAKCFGCGWGTNSPLYLLYSVLKKYGKVNRIEDFYEYLYKNKLIDKKIILNTIKEKFDDLIKLRVNYKKDLFFYENNYELIKKFKLSFQLNKKLGNNEKIISVNNTFFQIYNFKGEKNKKYINLNNIKLNFFKDIKKYSGIYYFDNSLNILLAEYQKFFKKDEFHFILKDYFSRTEYLKNNLLFNNDYLIKISTVLDTEREGKVIVYEGAFDYSSFLTKNSLLLNGISNLYTKEKVKEIYENLKDEKEILLMLDNDNGGKKFTLFFINNFLHSLGNIKYFNYTLFINRIKLLLKLYLNLLNLIGIYIKILSYDNTKKEYIKILNKMKEMFFLDEENEILKKIIELNKEIEAKIKEKKEESNSNAFYAELKEIKEYILILYGKINKYIGNNIKDANNIYILLKYIRLFSNIFNLLFSLKGNKETAHGEKQEKLIEFNDEIIGIINEFNNSIDKDKIYDKYIKAVSKNNSFNGEYINIFFFKLINKFLKYSFKEMKLSELNDIKEKIYNSEISSIKGKHKDLIYSSIENDANLIFKKINIEKELITEEDKKLFQIILFNSYNNNVNRVKKEKLDENEKLLLEIIKYNLLLEKLENSEITKKEFEDIIKQEKINKYKISNIDKEVGLSNYAVMLKLILEKNGRYKKFKENIKNIIYLGKKIEIIVDDTDLEMFNNMLKKFDNILLKKGEQISEFFIETSESFYDILETYSGKLISKLFLS